jgi:DNA polymerase/3'-5' exonuclease PolX
VASGNSYPLATARRIAEALLAELTPACERIVLAGSIRRERPNVNDIEIVAIPRHTDEPLPGQPSLFADPAPAVRRVNCLWNRIEEVSDGHGAIMPLKPGVPRIEPDPKWPEKRCAGSRYFKLFLPRTGLAVDLFMPSAESWGLILAIRTGSSEFSRALVTRWTQLTGGHAKEGRLHRADGSVVSAPEEEDVFRACGVEWISPRERIDAGSLHLTSSATSAKIASC